jgi:hypothetical protein
MENVYEKCIVKPRDAMDNIITLFSVIGAIGICVAAFLIEPVRKFALAVVVVAGYLAFRIITDRNIEYEYTLAGNSISLDRIINKRRRKRMLNCDLTDFDLIAPVASRHYEEHKDNVARVIMAVSGDNKDAEYFGIVQYDGKRTMLVFETDERAVTHIKKFTEHILKG